MREARSAAFYNATFRRSSAYQKDARNAPWALLWLWAASRLGEEGVLDLGCGPGHFAELLAERGHPPHLYTGVDFSKVAIEQAQQRVPTFDFVCRPLAKVRFKNYIGRTVVACEVLEHINNDLGLLKKLTTGTRVLLTVPTFDSAGHVRHFPTMHEAVKRYENVLVLSSVVTLGRSFGLEGVCR